MEGILFQTPGTLSQQTLLEALVVTGASASYFGEQYRDLLLYLHQKLNTNNNNQQIQTASWHKSEEEASKLREVNRAAYECW